MASGIGLQHDLQQVTRVQPQNRPAVGPDVADPLQPGLQPLHRLKRRRKDDVVDLARLIAALVDVADLAAEDEAHRAAAGGRHIGLDRGGQVGAQPEQTLFGGHELVAHLRQPAGVRDVARPDDVDALELRPAGQVLEGQVAAGGARKMRVDVEVGDKFHGWEPR